MSEKTDYQGNTQVPSQLLRELEDNNQLIKTLTDHNTFLEIIRKEFRGEQLYTNDEGESYWVQVDKPLFVELDKLNKPKKEINSITKKLEYIPNDEAISSIISVLKSCGLNQITPLTSLSENEIRDDLMEMESKIAALLFIKRKTWGINKSEYPIIIGNLKVLIKDARYKAKEGIVLRAIRTITSRTEQILGNRIETKSSNPFK